MHTNPISGRGCALGWVSAFELADVLAAKTDPARRAVAFEERIDALLRAAVSPAGRQHKQSIDINKHCNAAKIRQFVKPDGTIDEEKQTFFAIFRKGIRYKAAGEHPDVLRALFRQTNLLDLPDALFTRHDLLDEGCWRATKRYKTEELQLRPAARRNVGALCRQAAISSHAMKKLFLAMLATETNTFSPLPTGWNVWRDTVLRHTRRT